MRKKIILWLCEKWNIRINNYPQEPKIDEPKKGVPQFIYDSLHNDFLKKGLEVEKLIKENEELTKSIDILKGKNIGNVVDSLKINRVVNTKHRFYTSDWKNYKPDCKETIAITLSKEIIDLIDFKEEIDGDFSNIEQSITIVIKNEV